MSADVSRVPSVCMHSMSRVATHAHGFQRYVSVHPHPHLRVTFQKYVRIAFIRKNYVAYVKNNVLRYRKFAVSVYPFK